MHAFCSPLPIFGTRIGPRQKSFWPASSGNFPVTVFTRSNWHACKVDKINIPQRRRHKICSDEEDQENLKLAVRLTSLYIRIPKTHERNPGKMTFTTASGLLPAGIAVYVQRRPNGVHLEMRYLIRRQSF